MIKNIVEAMFSIIEWKDESLGYIECPGRALHSEKNSKKDCRVHIEGAPTIFCFHDSCSSIIEEANYKMRRAIWENKALPKREFSNDEKLKIKKDIEAKKSEQILRDKSKDLLKVILRKKEWCVADAFHESPLTSDLPENDSKLFLSKLYDQNDTIWNGDVNESGYLKNLVNFRTVKEWLELGVEGNFTCASIFKPGTYSRKNENVLSRPYLVVESDILNQDETCCVFKWLRGFMSLKAMVHTGGKSVHGWFKFPSDELYKKLEIMLPAMGFDRHLFVPSQPVRMTGVKRNDQWQFLCWLDA